MSIAIIIPCYNEETRLPLTKFAAFIENNPHVYFCFVNDGSTDHTSQLLHDFCQRFTSSVEVIDLIQNQGKAEAIRQGVQQLVNKEFPLIGFWDADLATPLEEINTFVNFYNKNPHFQFIMGNRHLRLGVCVRRRKSRHYLGRIFATAISISLSMPVYDSQCGAKIFTSNLAREIFREKFISRWFFDVELLFRIKKTTLFQENENIIYELPLDTWHDVGGTKLKIKDFFLAPWELIKINCYYRLCSLFKNP